VPRLLLPTWIIAPLSLALGFAVADLTGVRPIGGVVLFLGALWCGLIWRRDRGLPVALGLVVVYLAGFALSHPLGDQIGAWPSVAVIAIAVGAIVWAVVGRPTRMARA
jgi:hypothetical protein